MAKKNNKKETKFEQFGKLYGQFRYYNELLEKVQNGGSDPNLPGILENELVSQMDNYSGNEEKREEFEKNVSLAMTDLRNNLTNPYATTPLIRAVLERAAKQFEEFGKGNLEAILKSTPDEILSGALQYFAPDKPSDYHGSYKEIARLHRETLIMEQSLESLKDPNSNEVKKQNVLSQIKGTVAKHYAEEYKDNKTMAGFFQSLAVYGNDGKFALMKYELMLQDKKEDLEKELKENLTGYLKQSLGEKGLFELYQKLFEGKLKEAKRASVKEKYLYGKKEKDIFFEDD